MIEEAADEELVFAEVIVLGVDVHASGAEVPELLETSKQETVMTDEVRRQVCHLT